MLPRLALALLIAGAFACSSENETAPPPVEPDACAAIAGDEGAEVIVWIENQLDVGLEGPSYCSETEPSVVVDGEPISPKPDYTCARATAGKCTAVEYDDCFPWSQDFFVGAGKTGWVLWDGRLTVDPAHPVPPGCVDQCEPPPTCLLRRLTSDGPHTVTVNAVTDFEYEPRSASTDFTMPTDAVTVVFKP